MECVYCDCKSVDDDWLDINDKEWPVWICPECGQIVHREVEE